MDEDDGEQRASAQVEEVGVPAEDSRIGELDEGAEKGKQNRSVGVREAELVEVVNMRDAKVYWRNEDNMSGGHFGKKM